MMEVSQGPIFLGGLDRSGKTPLGNLLSRHPHLSLTRRTYMWTQFYNRFGDLSQPENFNSCLAAMSHHEPIRQLEPDLARIHSDFRMGERTYARLFALFHEQFADKVGKPRWVDQLAFVEYYADPIFAAYPTAKMIHMVRHPLERLGASLNYRQPRKGKVGQDISRWLYSVRLAKRNQQRYPDCYKVVQYETMLRQQKETLLEILAFLGEDFYPEMLVGNNGNMDPEDGLQDENSRRSAARVESRRWVSKGEIKFAQAVAGEEMRGLGYPTKPVDLSLRGRLMYTFYDWPANMAGTVLWKIKKDKRIRIA